MITIPVHSLLVLFFVKIKITTNSLFEIHINFRKNVQIKRKDLFQNKRIKIIKQLILV